MLVSMHMAGFPEFAVFALGHNCSPNKEGVKVWRLSSNEGKVVKTNSCQTKFPRASFIKSVSFILVLHLFSQILRN